MPTICLVNYAKTPLANPGQPSFALKDLAAALRIAVSDHLGPARGVACTIEVLDPAPPVAQLPSLLAGKWPLYLFDSTDQVNAEGYHEEETNGVVRGFAFVQTTLAAKDLIDLTISHELFELLVDPLTSRCYEDAQARFWIDECCDAVENSYFLVNGFAMSNFVLPDWYNPTPPAGARFDHLGHLHAPFTLEPGGYISYWTPKKGWSQQYGSKVARRHFESAKLHPYSRHTRRATRRKAR